MLAIQIKGKHIFCKSPVHYWTKENLLTTCNHEFTLQTCRSLLQKLCLVYNEQFAAASFGQHQNPSATTVFRWGCVCKEPPDEHSQSREGWSGRMPAHAHIFKGDWFWAKMLWLTPCPESTRGRKFPASLLKSCPMCCCGRIFSLRDVKKYFLLFPIRGAGKFQHEAIKRWTDCSSWGEAVLPLCSVFLCKAAFRHAKCQFPAVRFLVCLCCGRLLPAEQTNPKRMQKCICILTQEGENCTSDDGED